MNLEQYRKTLSRRMWIFRAAWMGYLLLLVARRFAGGEVTGHPAFSMLMGGMTGGLLVAALSMVSFRRAMKDDTALRRLYNTEHDERNRAIRARAGFPMVICCSLAMMAAALVATFFSMTVALTLVAAALAQLLVSLAVKIICMRTM